MKKINLIERKNRYTVTADGMPIYSTDSQTDAERVYLDNIQLNQLKEAGRNASDPKAIASAILSLYECNTVLF